MIFNYLKQRLLEAISLDINTKSSKSIKRPPALKSVKNVGIMRIISAQKKTATPIMLASSAKEQQIPNDSSKEDQSSIDSRYSNELGGCGRGRRVVGSRLPADLPPYSLDDALVSWESIPDIGFALRGRQMLQY